MPSSGFKPSAFGHFLLDRKIAEGGMAEVFLARQQGMEGFEKQVVIKRILPALTSQPDFVQMFLNEARLAARLNHPNVVQIFEAGEIDGQYYIAMEYIDGVDLRMLYDEAEKTKLPTPPGIACRIVADLLAGLHYAHALADEHGRSLGVVHRDVSPQNVLLNRTGIVKVVDFGIAKATRAAAQQTQAGQVKGKVAYMSPEQAMGRSVDARSDVFACGILLWELVTGERLFWRTNDMATILAITETDAPDVRSKRRELPEALDYLLKQALARSATDRFPSAHAMQHELEQLIRSEGWQADRRAVERHLAVRLPSTPSNPTLNIAEAATRAQIIEAPPLPRSTPPKSVPQEYGDGPTMLGSPLDRAAMLQAPPPAPALPIDGRAATVPISASSAEIEASDHNHPRVPSGSRKMPSEIPSVLADVSPPPERSRKFVAAPTAIAQPHPPQLAPTPPMGAYFEPPITFNGRRGSAGRRVAVVITAAVLASVVAMLALDWGGPPVAVNPSQAHVVITVEEPATVEIDGKRLRVESTGQIDIAPGKQTSVTATTLRDHDPQATRSIDLPPATAGEQLPLKISFPP